LAEHLKPGGVFGLWSNDAPDDAFRATLAEVFATTDARVITFRNARQDGDSTATIYLARHAGGRD
jgi:hypothetical protein